MLQRFQQNIPQRLSKHFHYYSIVRCIVTEFLIKAQGSSEQTSELIIKLKKNVDEVKSQ